MRSFTIIILHAFVLPGLASQDQLDKLGDKLVDRLLGAASSHRNNLDDTTFAKTHPDKGLGLSATRAQTIIASLPGPSAMKSKVVSAMQAKNRHCLVRDVSMKAMEDDFFAYKEKRGEAVPAWSGDKPVSKERLQEMAGVTAPMGVFDPLGIATRVPEGRLLFFREAELKHGRVCMLAFLGLIVGEKHAFIPLLGDSVPADTPAYLLGTPFVQETTVAKFWPLALLALFFEESRRVGNMNQDVQMMMQPTDALPGDYGWDPLGLKPKDAKGFRELQNKELNNGRLAMFASAGIIAAEQATGHNILR